MAFLKSKSFILGFVVVAVLAGVLFFPKVTLEKRLLASGKIYKTAKKWSDAVGEFERVVMYAPQSPSALEAARLGGETCLYELNDYPRAVFFFRHIVRHSQRVAEVRWAQENLAEIFYDKLSNYPQSVIEYQRLLQANPTHESAVEYKLRVGRSYFYMANFEQAISEASEFIAKYPQDPKVFDFWMLRANSLLAQKKYDEAITNYNQIESRFPDHPEFHQVKLNKSLAYEAKQDWDAAVRELDVIKSKYPHPDVIELKIKSILRRKERKKDS